MGQVTVILFLAILGFVAYWMFAGGGFGMLNTVQ
jgi:hypothetical protein